MVLTVAQWRGPTAPPFGPARGSQPGAQAGRHPGSARNCDRFKIAARTMAIGRGSQPAHFGAATAKIRTPMGKTRGKTTRESSKSGEKWRFFEGLKRHFAVLGAEVAQAQAIHFRGFISVEPGWRDPPRFPRIGCMAPFSNRARYKPTTLRSPGEGRSDVTRGGRLRQKRYN